MFGSKHKSSGDVAGTGKRHQELEAQRKDEERQEEEETEEPKSYLMQEMARGFYLFEEALLVSECARVCAVDSIVPNSLCPYRL